MSNPKENLIAVEAELYRKFRELALVFWKWRKAKRIYNSLSRQNIKGIPCPDCEGTGFKYVLGGVSNHPCKRCGKTGQIPGKVVEDGK